MPFNLIADPWLPVRRLDGTGEGARLGAVDEPDHGLQ